MVREQSLVFKSGVLTLEGSYFRAEDGAPSTAVVVCHPHPQYGGDMHNLVVATIVRGAVDAGLGAVAFNFRGAGNSEGSFDGGAGEREDVKAALAHGLTMPGIQRVALAGYSFGAGVAAGVADDSVSALALIALPPGMAGRGEGGLMTYQGTVLMVSGSNDNISPEAPLRELAARLPSPPQVQIIPGADHFWWGHERELADAVREFFAATLAASHV